MFLIRTFFGTIMRSVKGSQFWLKNIDVGKSDFYKFLYVMLLWGWLVIVIDIMSKKYTVRNTFLLIFYLNYKRILYKYIYSSNNI